MVSSLKELLNDSELVSSDDPEEKFIISGISWQKYEALLAKLEDNFHYRVATAVKVNGSINSLPMS
ncbi:hypothetical protein A2T98_08610 [Nodularia spumigena CENA596]|uniref:Uncharacterized protein n=1 Tax=Nodularia spumigena CENA596 TaxID=1819295 RepID=A0A166JWN0_NODSP|nr:hypothetical protein A2T98_08610 [Nodularia spumigena CENA596]